MDEPRKRALHGSTTINCREEIIGSMSKYFNNSEMSDIVLKIGDRRYYAHKFVLGLTSDVFRTMCSQRWELDGACEELEMRECEECMPVFDRFLEFLYCGTVCVDVDSALPLLMLADKYNIQPLKQSFEQYMSEMVNKGSVTGALRWLSYSQMSGHTVLQNACIEVLITKMDEVMSSHDFLNLEMNFLHTLLARDDLVVLWEQTILDGVEWWIRFHEELLEGQLQMLLSLIRFPMMTPTQLHGVETSELYRLHNDIMKPMISAAHRFRSIAAEVHSEAYMEASFRPRNYTHRLWCHFLTVDMNGEAFFQNSVGVCCLNHPVLSVPDQYWQVKVAGDKRTTRNSTGNKPMMLPNLRYSFSASAGVVDRNIPLTLVVTPLHPIKQDVIVDISLFQVKNDKLVKQLCQSTIKYASLENISIETQENMKFSTTKSGQSVQQSSQAGAALKFSPTPMHFSVMFQQSPPPERNEVLLKYSFGIQELDHPPEVPCFKFNGPLRMNNSVRVAIIFKPRFVAKSYEKESDKLEVSAASGRAQQESGILNSSLFNESEGTFLG